MQFKEATLAHIPQLHRVRIAVQQNVLSNPDRITPKEYAIYLTEKGKGWVCEVDDTVVGFSIVSVTDNNIWALFVLPQYEGKGIGKQLQHLMLQWYFTQTRETVWLSTEANTKAAEFYRNSGWKEMGWYNEQELKFEMRFEDWMASTGKP